MKKTLLVIAMFMAGVVAANAQGYTTLGIGIDTAQATLHVHSATPVSNGGVDQGELNRVLMQKVEELTLYIIDLQKQIVELKSEK